MELYISSPFKKHIEDLMLEWHIPGLGIAVFNAKEIKTQGFGLADINTKTSFTPDTIFNCASTSKALTAAAVAQLIHNNQNIKWDTPVSQLLSDDFVLPTQSATELTTIEDILSHRTGMPRHDDSYLGIRSTHPDTPQSITRALRHLPMTASPRTTFQYNNMMYTAASHLVSVLSGTSFSQYLTSHIFKPLSMSSAFLQPSSVHAAGQGARLAKAYRYDEDPTQYVELEMLDQPEGQGAGLIYSSISDWATWAQAVLTQDTKLLPKEGYAELLKPRTICNPDTLDEPLEPYTSYALYALGWEVEFYRGARVVSHTGGESGLGSLVLFMPEHDFGLVVFANSKGAYDVARILSMELVDARLDVREEERVDWAEHVRRKTGEEDEADAKKLDELREEILEGSKAKRKDWNKEKKVYEGTYSNVGYHCITVDVKDDMLHVDGSERGMPFDLTFEHVCDDTRFIASMADDERYVIHAKAEFRFEEGTEHAVAVGIGFESEMKDDLIWFDRISKQDVAFR